MAVITDLFPWRKCAALLVLLSISGVAHSAVWKAKHQWDDSWDLKYSEWVEKNFKTDFFMNPDRPAFYKLPHDCGDAPYFSRLAFAWENKLPFAIHDPLKKGRKLTQATRKFDHIKDPVKRLRAFMNYIGNRVSTRSLSADTYPIELKKLRAGDIYLSPGHHVYQIVGISETGVPTILSSTTPRKPRYLLYFRGFPMFVPSDMKKQRDGYRRFRRPQDLDKPFNQLPDYSAEQYLVAKSVGYQFQKFSNALKLLLGKRPEHSRETIARMVNEMCNLVRERKDYVDDGYNYLQKIRAKGRRCMNKEEYYHYSTVSRDKRLGAFFNQNRKEMNTLAMQGADPSGMRLLRAIFQPDAPPPALAHRVRALCSVETGIPDYPEVGLRDIWIGIWTGRLTSDPNAPLEYRWGVADAPWEPDCPVYED